ncbi:GNAT family N-acetyltransferase [Glycomyces halotolerans]
MSDIVVHLGYSGDGRAVAERVAGAFSSLAVAEWLVPDDVDRRRRILAGQFEMLVAPALAGHGHVDAALDDNGGLAGVAVWLDFTAGPLEPPPDYDSRLAELCGPHLARFQALDDAFERHHPDPAERPHRHLAFCAVDPARQDRGIGSLLLKQGLERLDKEGTAGYLEAANRRLVDWYARHGFEPLEPLGLPEGPSMFPMWRRPVPVA